MSKVFDFTRERLRRNAVAYRILFNHDSEGFWFVVDGIQDTKKDRLAVARDLENAAQSLRGDYAK